MKQARTEDVLSYMNQAHPPSNHWTGDPMLVLCPSRHQGLGDALRAAFDPHGKTLPNPDMDRTLHALLARLS